MKKFCLLVLCGLWCGLPTFSPAEEAASVVQPVLPQGDMLMTVKVTPREPGESSVRELKSITITRVGDTARYVLDWAKGADTEVWMDMAAGVRVEKDHTGQPRLARGTFGSVPRVAALDERAISWIRPEDRKGEATFQEKPAIHYKRRTKLPVEEMEGIEQEPRVELMEAWIDPETGELLATADNHATYVFVLSNKKPTAKLTIPKDHAAQIERYKRMLAPKKHL